MPEVKRQTAYKCSIRSILEGKYVQRPGWDPNYISFGDLQVSRINILSVILSRENNNFTIDDGTGQVQVMFFGERDKFLDFDVGDVVLIIGRPREYNGKRFVVPEIMRKINDKRWIEYRRLELESQPIITPQTEEPQEQENELPTDSNLQKEEGYEENYASIILATIKNLDKGEGANVNDVIKQSKLEKAEKYIISLINEGEIFEIRTGRLKILD
ncbi:MAG: OB-fold nucleic acid binding domain-containing protein [Candidatus Nanoarchaeia archaeon]